MSEPSVTQVIDLLFADADVARARAIMAEFEAGDVAHAQGPTRIPFAVLKVSEGRIDTLREAIEHAETDWRDTLLWAGFDRPEAHAAWAEALR